MSRCQTTTGRPKSEGIDMENESSENLQHFETSMEGSDCHWNCMPLELQVRKPVAYQVRKEQHDK
jgi:hypothetical protein